MGFLDFFRRRVPGDRASFPDTPTEKPGEEDELARADPEGARVDAGAVDPAETQPADSGRTERRQ